MIIRVALLPEFISSNINHSTAIVIDTLRFTTTACRAMASGATEICAAAEIDEIKALARECENPQALCGERQGHPIEGFDLGNSPFDYTPEAVAGKSLFFTTTNGTRAIAAARDANSICLASLANRAAMVAHLLEEKPLNVEIVCAGTDQSIALEDVLAAGAILAAIRTSETVEISGDGAHIALQTWQAIALEATSSSLSECIEAAFKNAAGGANLIDAGYARDLSFAARLDTQATVPRSVAEDWRRFR